jgi:hypothetical protein
MQSFLSAAQKLGYALKGPTDIVFSPLKTKTILHDTPYAEIEFMPHREHRALQLIQDGG